jgi:hypothetical protein
MIVSSLGVHALSLHFLYQAGLVCQPVCKRSGSSPGLHLYLAISGTDKEPQNVYF